MTVLRARETFFTGNHRKVTVGQLIDPKDPIVKGKEHLFEDVPDTAPVIEQATAAPGELRATKRKATSKK